MSEEFTVENLAQHVQNITESDNEVQRQANIFITAWATESPVDYIQALAQILQSCGDENMAKKCLTLLIRPFQTAMCSLKGDEELIEKFVPPPEITNSILEILFPLFSNESEMIRNISKSVFASGASLLVRMDVEYDPISLLLGEISEETDEATCISIFSCLADIFETVDFQAEQIKAVYQAIIPLLSNDNPNIIISIINLLKSLRWYFVTVFQDGTQELTDFFTIMLTLTQEEALVCPCMEFWAYTAEESYQYLKEIPQIMDLVLGILQSENEDAIRATIQFVNSIIDNEMYLEDEDSHKMILGKLGELLEILIQISVQIESEETEFIDCVQSDALECLCWILKIPGVLEEATEVLMQFIGEGVQGTAGQVETAIAILEAMINSEKVDQGTIIPPSIECATAALGSENPRIVVCGLSLMNTVITNCPTAEDFKQLINEDLLTLLDNEDVNIYEGTAQLIQSIINIDGFTEFEDLFNICIERHSVGSIIVARAIINILHSPELIVPHIEKIFEIVSLAVEENSEAKASEAVHLAKEAVINAKEAGVPYNEHLFTFAKNAFDKFHCAESISAISAAARIDEQYLATAMSLIISYTDEEIDSVYKQQAIESVIFYASHCENIASYIGPITSNLLRICYSTKETFSAKISAFQAFNSLIVFQYPELEKFMDRVVRLFMSATIQYEKIDEDSESLVNFLDSLVDMSSVIFSRVEPDENLVGAALKLIDYVASTENINMVLLSDSISLLDSLMAICAEQIKEMFYSAPKYKALLQEALEYLDSEEDKEKVVKIAEALEIPLDEPTEEE